MRPAAGFWRRLAAVFAAGFLLRAAVAVADARHPLFPARYYQDERDYAEVAARVNAYVVTKRRTFSISPGKELYTQWVAALLRGFGPLAPRLFNAAAGAGSAALWGLVCAQAAGPAAGLGAAAFLALWPSHAFHTAQAIKEAPIALLEFDLGSASRHRLHLVPCLLPFAWAGWSRRPEPKT